MISLDFFIQEDVFIYYFEDARSQQMLPSSLDFCAILSRAYDFHRVWGGVRGFSYITRNDERIPIIPISDLCQTGTVRGTVNSLYDCKQEIARHQTPLIARHQTATIPIPPLSFLFNHPNANNQQ